MIEKHEIRECLNIILEKIMSEDESVISKICDEKYFSSKFVLQEIEEYPGKISRPEKLEFSEGNINRINENDLYIYFNLWFDDMESDLVVTVRITKMEGMLNFYIDEVHVH